MSDAREVFKESIRNVVGDYITNEVDLNNLVNYLYKVSIVAFKDSNMQEEYQNLAGINSIDVEGFKKSLHTISINASRDLMFRVMKGTFQSLKNQVPPTKVVSNIETKYPTVNVTNVSTDNNVAPEFSIDLSTANQGKPSMQEIAKATFDDLKAHQGMFGGIPIPMSSGFVSREVVTPDTLDFNISPESLSNINKGIPRNIKPVVTSNPKDDDFDFTGDSSIYTEGSYDSEPSVDISLDY